jgi:hypothetical protein
MLVVITFKKKSIRFLPSKTIYDNGYFDFFVISNVFPKIYPIATHFYHTCFAQSSHIFTFIGGPKGTTSSSNINFYFEKTPIVLFCCDGPIKMAHCKKEK